MFLGPDKEQHQRNTDLEQVDQDIGRITQFSLQQRSPPRVPGSLSSVSQKKRSLAGPNVPGMRTWHTETNGANCDVQSLIVDCTFGHPERKRAGDLEIAFAEGTSPSDTLPIHVYLVTVAEWTQRQLASDLLQRAFNGSAKNLILGVLSARRTSKQELEEIRKLLDEYEEGKQ